MCNAVCRSPRSSWPDELLSTAQLWPGDVESEDDAAAITREERTLRCWINSVLHQGTNALSAAAAVTTTSSDPLQGRLSHTYSVDSCLRAGRVQAQGSGDAATGAACPLRTQSTVGGSADGSQQRSGPLQLPAGATPGGISGASSSAVFRSSSAGAAAVAAHLDGSGAGSSLTHTRSISADAPGAAADLSLDGWGGKPAAPTTPTSPAAIAAAGAGAFTPLHAGAGVRSCAVVVPSISSVSSLFGAELRSGVLLLEILELLQPGCVDWRLANRPPFVSRTAQLKALENCQLALNIAQVCVSCQFARFSCLAEQVVPLQGLACMSKLQPAYMTWKPVWATACMWATSLSAKQLHAQLLYAVLCVCRRSWDCRW